MTPKQTIIETATRLQRTLDATRIEYAAHRIALRHDVRTLRNGAQDLCAALTRIERRHATPTEATVSA